MKLPTTFLFFILITGISACKEAVLKQPAQSILLFKDSDGLYEFDFISKTEKLIYKLRDEQYFRDENCEITDNTLTFGVTGNFDDSNKYVGFHYSDYYITVDLKSGKSRVSREAKYSFSVLRPGLHVKVVAMDGQPEETILSDTTNYSQTYEWSYRGPLVFGDKGRQYSEHSVGNKKVYSRNGEILYTMSDDGDSYTDSLALYEYFDNQFPGGYFQPQLDPTGTYAICTFEPGVGKGNPSLNKITLADREMTVIKEGKFGRPQFSADGQYVLFQRNAEINKRDVWESEIYLLNLKTLEETEIGKAGFAEWQ